MTIIRDLAEMIREELDDSERYAKCALKHKDDEKLSDMFLSLSKAELEHADVLHGQASRLIKDYDGYAPPNMQAVWDWEHELLIDHKARIKSLYEMYK